MNADLFKGGRESYLPLALNDGESWRLHLHKYARGGEQVSAETGKICCYTINLRSERGGKFHDKNLYREVCERKVQL